MKHKVMHSQRREETKAINQCMHRLMRDKFGFMASNKLECNYVSVPENVQGQLSTLWATIKAAVSINLVYQSPVDM